MRETAACCLFSAIILFLLAAVAVIAVVGATIVVFSWNRPQSIDNGAVLATISVGLATAAFPWTISGRWEALFRRTFQVSSLLMLFGALFAAISLGIIFIGNEAIALELEGNDILNAISRWVSRFGLLAGGWFWLLGLTVFVVVYVLAGLLWLKDESPDEEL